MGRWLAANQRLKKMKKNTFVQLLLENSSTTCLLWGVSAVRHCSPRAGTQPLRAPFPVDKALALLEVWWPILPAPPAFRFCWRKNFTPGSVQENQAQAAGCTVLFFCSVLLFTKHYSSRGQCVAGCCRKGFHPPALPEVLDLGTTLEQSRGQGLLLCAGLTAPLRATQLLATRHLLAVRSLFAVVFCLCHSCWLLTLLTGFSHVLNSVRFIFALVKSVFLCIKSILVKTKK